MTNTESTARAKTFGSSPPAELKLLTLRKRFVYSLATHVIPNSAAGSEDIQRLHGVPSD